MVIILLNFESGGLCIFTLTCGKRILLEYMFSITFGDYVLQSSSFKSILLAFNEFIEV